MIRSKDYVGAIGQLEAMRERTQGKNIDACIAWLKTEQAQKAKKANWLRRLRAEKKHF